MTKHEIGTLEDFPLNDGTHVNVDGIDVAVFNVDGELYGIQNMCVHKNLPLHIIGDARFRSEELESEYDTPAEDDIRGVIDDEKLSVRCPWHHLEWDLRTGENKVKNVRIATYDVEVDGDGTVWIEI